MYQKSKSYLDDFECPRCGHCCQALVDETAKRKHIKTWHERCEEHPDHQEKIISERMIQARMQEEIDELRQALETKQEPVAWISEGGDVSRSKRYMDEMGFKCNPLYTSPQKQWVGLTDEDMEALFLNEDGVRFARYIEAKLKEKNHE